MIEIAIGVALGLLLFVLSPYILIFAGFVIMACITGIGYLYLELKKLLFF